MRSLLLFLVALATTSVVAQIATPGQTDIDYAIQFNNWMWAGRIDMPNILLGYRDATFEVQVYLENLNRMCIYQMGSGYARVMIWTEGGRLYAQNGDSYASVSSRPVLKAKTWYLLTVVFNNNYQSPNTRLYINGELDSTGTTGNIICVAARAGKIGQCDLNSQLLGKVDNFRLFDYIRSDDDIRTTSQLVYPSFPSNMLKFYLPMEEGRGTALRSYGEGRTGTLVSGHWTLKDPWSYTCRSTGDPHMTKYDGGRYEFQTPGYYVMAKCRGLEVRNYQYWTNGNQQRVTSNYRVAVYALGDVFLEEFDVGGNGARPQTHTLNGVTQGSVGSGVRPTGVVYQYDNKQTTIMVPGTGQVTVVSSSILDVFIEIANDCGATVGTCAGNIWSIPESSFPFRDLNPPSQPPPPITPPADVCGSLPASFISSVVEPACDFCVKSRTDPRWADCKTDVCATGLPESALDHCREVERSCEETARAQLTAWVSAGNSMDTFVNPCPKVCPNSCSLHGQCVSGRCQCDSGYVGEDCGRKQAFACFTADYNDVRALTIRPYVVERVTTPPYAQVSSSNLGVALQSTKKVKDSVLMYVAQTLTDDRSGPAYHLFLMGDDVDATGGTVSVSVSGSAFGSMYKVSTTGTLSAVTGTSTSMTWDAYNSPGMIMTPMGMSTGSDNQKPQNCYTLTITSTSSKQVLVGSGNPRGEMDIYKVLGSAGGVATVQFCSGTCQDTCWAQSSCQACAAQPTCGWCQESQTCLYGTASGPTRQMCSNWRFSFDDNVARRLTTTLGFPVSPQDTEVLLTMAPAVAKLPVDVAVATGNPAQVIWDVVLLVQTGKSNSDDLTQLQSQVLNLIPRLRAQFPSLGLAIGTFADLPGNGFSLLSPIRDVNFAGVSSFQTIFNNMQTSNAGDEPNSQLLALSTLGDATLTVGWRAGARRIAIMMTDSTYHVGGSNYPSVVATRRALLTASVMPVFAATSGVRATYMDLVSQLHFGAVVALDDDSGNGIQAIEGALVLAAGQISLAVNEAKQGNLDWNMADATNYQRYTVTGLPAGTQAHFVFFMKQQVSSQGQQVELIAPGYGKAEIEDVLTDKPSATAQQTYIFDENPTFGNWPQSEAFKGYVIELSGTAVGDQDVSAVIEQCTGMVGQLFQYAVDRAGAPIACGSAAVPVTDWGNRVVYLPVAYEYSPPNVVYSSFSYHVTDGCLPSASRRISLMVNEVRQPPECSSVSLQVNEDNDVNIALTAVERDYTWSGTNKVYESFTMFLLNSRRQVVNPDTGAQVAAGMSNPLARTSLDPASGNSPRTVHFHPDQDWNGVYTMQFQARDASGAFSDVCTATVTVLPVNDAPVVSFADPVYGLENDTFIKVVLRMSDVDTMGLTMALDLTGMLGTLYEDSALTKTVANGRTFVTSDNSMTKTLFWVNPNLEGVSNCTESFPPVCTVPLTSFKFRALENAGSPALTSAWTTVSVFLIPVNDAPILPTSPLSVTMNEDNSAVVALEGATDVDNRLSDLSVFLTTLPALDTYQVLRTATGQVLNKTMLVPQTESYSVTVRPVQNVFGNVSDNFKLGQFTYRAFDGVLPSVAERPVVVYVIPQNDAPVPATTLVSAIEDTNRNFALEASDIDTPQRNLTFKLLTLPTGEKATLQDGTKVPSLALALDTVLGKSSSCTSAIGEVACVQLTLYPNFWGNITFSYTVTDTDMYGRGPQAYTVSQQVRVWVAPVNDAPNAQMGTPFCNEDELCYFTLDGWDVENDTFTAHVLTTVPAKDGMFYVWNEAVWTAYKSNGDLAAAKAALTPLTDDSQIADAQRRVMYVPPLNKNSNLHMTESKDHMIMPMASYRVEEVAPETPPALQSASQPFLINVAQVNDAPLTWDDATPLGDGTTEELCYSTCDFHEDFDAVFPNRPAPKSIWLGGHDVESDMLTAIVTAIQCNYQAEFYYYEDAEATAWTQVTSLPVAIPNLVSDVLQAGLFFRPGQDLWDASKPYFCQVTYQVKDSYGAVSAASKVVTLRVSTEVNDAPRLTNPSTVLSSLEDKQLLFTVDGKDPESDQFDLVLNGCYSPLTGAEELRGTLKYADANGEWVEYDCTAGHVLPVRSPSNVGSWRFAFDPVPEDSDDPYTKLYFYFVDTKGTKSRQYEFTINVFPVNDPPVWSNAEIMTTPRQSVYEERHVFEDSETSWSGVSLADIDVNSFLQMAVFVSVKPTGATVMMNTVNGLNLGRREDGNGVSFNFTATQAQLNQIVHSLSVHVPTDSAGKDWVVTILVSDRGYTGYCSDGVQKFCPQTANYTVRVRSTEAPSTIDTVTATGIGAAALVVATGVGVASWKRLNSNPQGEEYEPWLLEDTDTAVANPMYQESGNKGTNPLFEA